ncbi:immunoglobulin-like domain-containing protein [Bacillus salipaludis]|uniref:immunoglobulin-like domain-containing protein n=1 Tax=Bacillus salipaludis TaxID=2547811 RepID=UPI003D19D02B
MKNYKSKFVKIAVALLLVVSVLTAAVVIDAPVAGAQTTYKVSHNKLINAKTKKVVKGYKTYKNKLYKDGKLYTGVYHSITYYKGNKFTGLKKGKLYKSGKLVSTYTLYKGKLYKKGGALNKGRVVYKGKLYNGHALNKGYAVYGSKLYNGYTLNKGYVVYASKLYNGYSLNKGYVVYASKLYNGYSLNKGYVKYGNKMYNGYSLFTGEYNGVVYKNGLAVPDTKAPVITLSANGPFVVLIGTTFTLPTATAVDDRDKAVSVKTSIKNEAGQIKNTIDTSTAGKYTVSYTAVDKAGNKSEKTITIIIEASFEVIDIQ